ncbi:hypothetical protein O181_087975 [Austropuccinia psidii MF-1]|uniref:Uncharacterized protein n=1 Tax=Austropuccinia psidii MF-1 TaxID=1389203 RepID=A0A9Q3IQX3_9BASI|nr:hypothetical protein [Austropuccinia psidii MF-1]
MSDPVINIKILRKCGVELENSVKCIWVQHSSPEDYISAMEDIITRTRSGKTWTGNSMESKIAPKTAKGDRRPEIPV